METRQLSSLRRSLSGLCGLWAGLGSPFQLDAKKSHEVAHGARASPVRRREKASVCLLWKPEWICLSNWTGTEKARRKAKHSPSAQSSFRGDGVPAGGGRMTRVPGETQRILNSYLRKKGAHLGARATVGGWLADSGGVVGTWLWGRNWVQKTCSEFFSGQWDNSPSQPPWNNLQWRVLKHCSQEIWRGVSPKIYWGLTTSHGLSHLILWIRC